MDNRKTVVALGKFDGVHAGHTHLLKTAVSIARDAGLPALAYTFQSGGTYLMNEEEKNEMLISLGIDRVHTQALTDAFCRMSAEEFVRDVLAGELNAQHVVVGFNYRFGHRRSGDAALLTRLCAVCGVEVTVIPPVEMDGAPVSSTRIRSLLEQGDMRAVETLLGRRYAVSGIVSHGKKLGRTLGFPTVNLLPAPELLLPRRGVYATLIEVDGVWHKGVTNVGPNPTVETDAPDKVETHLLDFDGDLYGRHIRVEFVEQIRGEKTFSSVEELREQISLDTKTARRLL